MPRKKIPVSEHVLHYRTIVGDPQPIIDDKRPLCAECGSKKTAGILELIQHGMFEDVIILVRRCKDCGTLTSYHYSVVFEVT